jgi:heme-degrading monooxygenase HmoA
MTDRVVRVWRGYGTSEGVDRYCREHFEKRVLPQLQELDGFIGASVLVRSVGSGSEVVVATTWASIESIEAFAGEDHTRAVVEPVVREMLSRFDDEVTHFRLAHGPCSDSEVS